MNLRDAIAWSKPTLIMCLIPSAIPVFLSTLSCRASCPSQSFFFYYSIRFHFLCMYMTQTCLYFSNFVSFFKCLFAKLSIHTKKHIRLGFVINGFFKCFKCFKHGQTCPAAPLHVLCVEGACDMWLRVSVSRWQNALRDKTRFITALCDILKGSSLKSQMLSRVSKTSLLLLCLIPFKSCEEDETRASLKKNRFNLITELEFSSLRCQRV